MIKKWGGGLRLKPRRENGGKMGLRNSTVMQYFSSQAIFLTKVRSLEALLESGNLNNRVAVLLQEGCLQ